MSALTFASEILWTIISFFQFSIYPSTTSVRANLNDLSANAKTYEEWLHYQEELDALSGRNEWLVTSHPC